MNDIDITKITNNVLHFVDACHIDPDTWRFSSVPGGPETLYACGFASMLYYYLGRLENLDSSEKRAWADYINSFQDPETGLFEGPELVNEELTSHKHSREHIAHHLAAHIIPALEILGGKPAYPLRFAHPYLDLEYLKNWLDARNWREVWLEGNNLLFIGQFLIHLRDVEGRSEAQPAIDLYFDWLDKEIDMATGLWGTNGYCGPEAALYGGYHQLLVYYCENRPLNAPRRLVDVALSLQNADGSFDPYGRGSACQDTDAIDILVNLYKIVDYKRPQIRIALRGALKQVLHMQMPDGGFVNRRDEQYSHMGVRRTTSQPDQSNMFTTWFRVHSLALLAEILTDEPIADYDWKFNHVCSMGWHRSWRDSRPRLGWTDHLEESLITTKRKVFGRLSHHTLRFRRAGGKYKRRLLSPKEDWTD